MPVTGTILTDCKIYLGGYNLSGFHNSMELNYAAEMLDDTAFGTSGTRSNKPGLKTFSFSGHGFWDTTQDGANFARIGATREVMSFAPVGNVEGDRAFTVRAVNAKYNPISGEVGALLGYDFDAMAANTPLVRGAVMATGSKAVTGSGAVVNLGPVGALQRVYSALHVTAVAATSIIVVVESSAVIGMTSPTTRITHTTFLGAGTIGADWQFSAVGAVTDAFWRTKWTIVGGPFTIYNVVGIQ